MSAHVPDAAGRIAALCAEAAAAFGVPLDAAQCALLEQYAGLVAKWQRITNLTGAIDAEAFAREHVLDALAVVPYVQGHRVLDVGSGNGLPGIVLAIARPDLAVCLLEPRARRARFLTQARIELGLARVEVVCARVERHHPAEAYDVIVAQAFAALGTLLAPTAHLRGPATRVLALKGRLDPAELAAAGVAPGLLTTHVLAVPGRGARHLVVVTGAALKAGANVP